MWLESELSGFMGIQILVFQGDKIPSQEATAADLPASAATSSLSLRLPTASWSQKAWASNCRLLGIQASQPILSEPICRGGAFRLV